MMNQLKTILLMGVLSSILIGVGAAMGSGWMYGALFIALLMNLVSWFFSDRIVLAMHGAKEIDPMQAADLHAMVQDLSRRAGIPTPRLYWIPDPSPNAFATGRNPEHAAVAVTQGLLDRMGEREVRAVLAHEIAHVANRDTLIATVAAAIAAAVANLASIAQWALIFGRGDDEEEGGGGLAGSLLFMIVGPIAATLIQLGISRSREYLADETAARLTGDPEGLASALERLQSGVQAIHAQTAQPATASLYIVNPLAAGGALLSLFSTHPPIHERVKRLRQMRIAA